MKKWAKRIVAVALAVWAAWNAAGVSHEQAEPIRIPFLNNDGLGDSGGDGGNEPGEVVHHWLEELGFSDGGDY